MTIQKLKLAVAGLTACVGVVIAGGVALRAQPGDPPPAAPSGAAQEPPNAPEEPPVKRAGAAGPQDEGNPSPRDQIDESAKKVKELRKERIAILKELVDQATRAFQSARASYEEVLEAQMLLLQAELDAAEKESERIAIYQMAIDALKQSEKLAAARVQAGRGTQAAVLRIKARRLEVEIQLEQAKIKEAKEKK